jgi:RNA polymerase sigma-70 factor (ECF subfamily)
MVLRDAVPRNVVICLNIPSRVALFRLFDGRIEICLNKRADAGIHHQHVQMAEPLQTPAVSLLSRLSRQETARPGELEVEIVGLFDQMRDRLLRYALSFGLAIPDAEEVVQEVFLALYRHLSAGKSRDGLCGWLFRVTHNLSLKCRLATARAPEITSDAEGKSILIADPNPGPEEQYALRQRQDRLRSVVDALPQTDRECLYLRSEGFRYREIAEIMGISVGSVANSLAKSLSRLSAAAERLG